AEGAEKARVPTVAADVVEERAARVRCVGGVDLAGGELPEEPGIHRAEGQRPAGGARASALHVSKEPLELGGREIRIEPEPGDAGDPALLSGAAEGRASVRG